LKKKRSGGDRQVWDGKKIVKDSSFDLDNPKRSGGKKVRRWVARSRQPVTGSPEVTFRITNATSAISSSTWGVDEANEKAHQDGIEGMGDN